MIIRLNNGYELEVKDSTNERCISFEYTLDNIQEILTQFTNENVRYFVIIKESKKQNEQHVFHLKIQNIILNNGVCNVNLTYADETERRINELESFITDLYDMVMSQVFNNNNIDILDDLK